MVNDVLRPRKEIDVAAIPDKREAKLLGITAETKIKNKATFFRLSSTGESEDEFWSMRSMRPLLMRRVNKINA